MTPKFEVYTREWAFLGYIEDRGTKASLVLARRQYGPIALWLVPTLV